MWGDASNKECEWETVLGGSWAGPWAAAARGDATAGGCRKGLPIIAHEQQQQHSDLSARFTSAAELGRQHAGQRGMAMGRTACMAACSPNSPTSTSIRARVSPLTAVTLLLSINTVLMTA